MMADLEVSDFEVPWKSYTLPSIAKKRKKSKKDHKRKDKSGVAMKNEGRTQKKKKNKKLREAMKGMKDKKKKSKKNRAMKLAVEDLISANSAFHQSEQSLKTDQTLVKKSEGSYQNCCEPSLNGSPSILRHRKVTKKKKKVAFELGYGSSVAKYPKVVAPSTQLPEVNVSSIQSEGSMGSDILVEGALKKHFQTEPQNNNESQCTSDDINSQDLFITQKRFRAPSIDQSSEEITEEGIGTMRHVHQYGEMHEKVRPKEPKKQRGHHRLPHEELSELTEKASANCQKLEMELLEEDISPKPKPCRGSALHPKPKRDAKTIQPPHLTPKRISYLAKPLSLSIEVRKSPEVLGSEPPPTCKVSDTSTQTENFFSTELCRYLKFYQQSRLDNNRLEFTALDLSLPPNIRVDPGKSLLDSVNTSALKIKGVVGATGTQTSPPIHSAFRPGKHEDFIVSPPSSSEVKGNKETLDRKAPCTSQVKVETSPQSEAEPKSSDTTASEAEPKSSDTTVSSEDNEASIRSGRADLQVIKYVV